MNDFQKFQRLVIQRGLHFVVEVREGEGVYYYVRDVNGFLGKDFEYKETYHGAIDLSHTGQHWNARTVADRVKEIEQFYNIRAMDTFEALNAFLDRGYIIPLSEWKELEAHRKALEGGVNQGVGALMRGPVVKHD